MATASMNPEALQIIQRYDRLTEKLEQSTITRLNSALDGSYRALEREFLKTYPKYQGQSLLARQRALLVMDQLSPLVSATGNEPVNEIALKQGVTEAWNLGSELASATYQAIGREELQLLSNVPIEAVALQARDGVKRLAKHGADFAGRMSGVVEQGLVQGWGSRKVADVLRNEHGLTKVKAETIARTELLSAQNDAAQQRYQDAGIQYCQWVCNSGETCVFCVARNMQVYEVGKVRLPAHPRCRCVWLPYSKQWQELGLTDDLFAAKYRADRIADLERDGGKVNTGISPFEKSAGLTEAPKPVWILGQKSFIPVTTEIVKSLPSNHVVSINSRYSTQLFDNALDQIQSPGAKGRVQQFRQFVNNQEIQVVLYDRNASKTTQLSHFRKSITYQGGEGKQWGDEYLADATIDLLSEPAVAQESGVGFTSTAYRHITIGVNNRTGSFGVDSRGLQRTINTTFAGAADDAPEDVFVWAITDGAATKDELDFLAYLHETGHQVHYAAGVPRYPDNVKGCITEYSTQDDYEWFAEHFSAWMLDAEGYRKLDPVGASFIEDTFKKAVEAPRRLD